MNCKIPLDANPHTLCPDCGHIIMGHIWPDGECTICPMANMLDLYVAHTENLIQRVAELENRLGYGPDNDTALSRCDLCLGKGVTYEMRNPEGTVCQTCNGTGRRWTEPWL